MTAANIDNKSSASNKKDLNMAGNEKKYQYKINSSTEVNRNRLH